MKITKELKSLPQEELDKRLLEMKKELLKQSVQANSGANTQNPGKLREVKKNIARIKTIVKEREVKDK
jgi:large subunit ribosomal protein L29